MKKHHPACEIQIGNFGSYMARNAFIRRADYAL